MRLTRCGGYLDQETGDVCIVEHHYREPATYYEVVTRSMRLSVLMPPRELLLNIPGKSIAISPAETTGRTSTTFTYRNNFA